MDEEDSIDRFLDQLLDMPTNPAGQEGQPNPLIQARDNFETLIDKIPKNLDPKLYTVLTADDVRSLIKCDVILVSKELDIPHWNSLRLLIYFEWDKFNLHEAWSNSRDSVSLELGLSISNPNLMNTKCLVCQIDFVSRRRGMICLHFLCEPCWKSYAQKSVSNGPDCLMLTCPVPSCKAAVPDHTILELLEPESKVKYLEFLSKSYKVYYNIKNCPNPDCTHSIQPYLTETFTSSSNNDVTCLCSYTFCFECLNQSHYPVECHTVSNFVLKLSSAETESGFSRYCACWEKHDKEMRWGIEILHDIKVSRIPEFRLQNCLFKFLTESWEELIECRRLLKWSYVYAYFLEEADRANFEVVQKHAESGVSYFQSYLTKFTESYSFKEFGILRKEIIQLTEVAKDMMKKFVASMES